MTQPYDGRLLRPIKLGACAFLIVAVVAAMPARVHSASATPMRFGIDMASLDRARGKGLAFAYGVLWTGAWTQKQGWSHAESGLLMARSRNVTPVINWWYWGDDISPMCIERGCRDRRQGVDKDLATWYRMSDELSTVIERTMGSRETIVVLESEFNKGGIESSEAFDGHLAEVAAILHRRGNVKVVLGFGNWGREHWSRFDRAIAAADYLGTQLLRSSVRDGATYLTAVDTLIGGAQYLQRHFNKPSFVVDLALSSYPAATHEAQQAAVTEELQRRMPELKAAGVRAIFYRMIADDPMFDTSNYHGVAERHWGLLRADGSEKPAYAPFAATVLAETAEWALNGSTR